MPPKKHMESEDDTTQFEHLFQTTIEEIELLLNMIDVLEKKLDSLHRPLQLLTINQMGNLDFLQVSSFRFERFRFRNETIAKNAGLDPSKRYTYEEICSTLRNYLIKNNHITPSGNVKLNDELKQLFEIEEDSISYLLLLQKLRHVLW